ncbi:hypothetical protein AUJ77_02825 [Candidatus Nomurabacteria bacterium CG1_02_43_90]|uniref:CfrBI family restriction endonuclease n=1 Tax=Candidatus Nomurabacteria bacterium CG1_02_43_90 TaxID=1805281 RepID=A0A1J4V409_9BACT|nr:MAG: hypothetical protein AUJ77_02825 [Candidatus Nomurabacteria bacterium CG1_02_43_90]PIR56652.1 MAG: hypothetical protein COU72_05140 [Parcubacteria group bacterium CG10_big_fil_rev_8_21_14_0_10_41_35]
MKIVSNYPKKEKELLVSKGPEVIKKIGNEAVREAVFSVLSGENVRNSTEFITRRRLAISNGALLAMFLRGCNQDKDFLQNLSEKAVEELKVTKKKDEKWILEWLLGLTDKAVQNILRDNPDELDNYRKKLDETLIDAVTDFEKNCGALEGNFKFEGKDTQVSWTLIMKVFLAIGAQTLTIRGSEKSTYGKMFERLVLGSLLEILGFTLIDHNNPPDKLEKVFWLSSTEKRESDATIIIKPGQGIRFDIGFIGRGNPEISLDKVTRFEREMTFGRQTHYMGTYIVVDRIGEKSSIEELAKAVGGSIIQMSLAYWPRTIAELLKKDVGYEHPILKMKDAEMAQFLRKALDKVDVVKYVTDEE